MEIKRSEDRALRTCGLTELSDTQIPMKGNAAMFNLRRET